MADTHVPKRARDLPPALWGAVDAADVVVHAGDWVHESLLDALERRSARLVGVYGNINASPRMNPGDFWLRPHTTPLPEGR
jgi:predicted phosphodiesterase